MNPVEWTYLCQKSFHNLNGDELSRRHCSDCNLVVINFDVLSEDEQFSVLKEAAISGRRLCVALTHREAGASSPNINRGGSRAE